MKLWRSHFRQKKKHLRPSFSPDGSILSILIRYIKYLYPYELHTLQLSTLGELQAAIDSNRRDSQSSLTPTTPGTIERLGESGARGFGPNSRESGPNRTRWTTKEVRWVVNERAMVVIANTTIARKTVQLVRWSCRKAWVVQSCQSAGAPDSALAESCIGVVSPVEILCHTSLDPRPWHGLWVVCHAGLT